MLPLTKLFRLFIFTLSLVIMPFISIAATVTTTIDGITYTADDANIAAGATATAYDRISQGANLVIPASITISGNDYAITTVGVATFRNANLNSAVIPNSVITIEADAFRDNNLTNVVIPDSVITIGRWAFYESNISNLTLGNSVTTIVQQAFQYNNISSLTIPNSLNTIDRFVFFGNNLTTVTIPANIAEIGLAAFRENNITEVWFEGNAPILRSAELITGSFAEASGKTLYYDCSKTGFTTPTWQGYNTQSYCTVTFDSQGGTTIPEERVITGNPATLPITIPTQTGYTFDGWYIDAAGTTAYDFSTLITNNVTLYAKWTPSAPASTDIKNIPTTSLWALMALMGVVLLLGCALLYQNLQSRRGL